MMNKRERREAAIQAGREYAREWLIDAERHGAIYYTIPHVARSGMTRHVVLGTVRPVRETHRLENLWPRTLDPDGTPSDILDIIAKDWGFSFKHRAFIVGGCGFDAVHHVIYGMAWRAFGDSKEGLSYASRVRREHFG